MDPALTSPGRRVIIVALPETAGSALYGMLDVLSATGSIWQTLSRTGDPRTPFEVRIMAPASAPFDCGNGIPVKPDCAVADDPVADLVIVPELWLGPDESLNGRYPEVVEWLVRRHAGGAHLYSACSGAILLAESGLLDGCPATSHWGYQDLFQRDYPKIRFDPAPSLVSADLEGRIVTAGGTTSWHDLAIHIIARHVSPSEALRVARVYLLKWHDEGQLAYANLDRRLPHGDAAVSRCEAWLREHYTVVDALARVVERAGVPGRTLKRRFKAATGSTLIEYLQNLRIEAAKTRLETDDEPVDAISEAVGYSDASFFRRLFKRCTGMTPSGYRRLFGPIARAS